MPTYKTKSDFQNELWGRVSKGSQGALEMALKQQIAEKQRQQGLEDYKKKLEIQKQMGALRPPTTSISISERPYTEMLKARQVLGIPPEEYYAEGMATGKGKPEGGWFFGLGNKGYATDAKGAVMKNKPLYKEYDLSPEAIMEQEEARKIIANPYKVTKRLGGQDSFNLDGVGDSSEAQSPESRFDELVSQGLSEDEAYKRLKDEGYTL